MRNDINTQRISAVFNALGELQEHIVFVGGATLSVYAEIEQTEIRPTKDVDLLVELVAYSDFAKLEEEIRRLGFKNDVESGVICRFKLGEIIVDIMPTDEKVIGFSNKWYKDGFESAVECELTDDNKIKIFSAPYFLASKLEAFKSRGKYDGRTSHDFEDIVFLLENRPSIWIEIEQVPQNLAIYLKTEFAQLLEEPLHAEWIGCHVERWSPPSTYFIIEKMEAFVAKPTPA